MFDTKKFMQEKFVPRTAEVPMEELKDYFGENDKPVFVVRCLEGMQIGKAKEAAAKNRNVRAILDGIMSQRSKDVTDAINKILGNSDDVPQDVAEKIEYVMAGLVEPSDWQLDQVLWLYKNFPINFYALSQKVLELTGLGHIPGKQKPSGKAPK